MQKNTFVIILLTAITTAILAGGIFYYYDSTRLVMYEVKMTPEENAKFQKFINEETKRKFDPTPHIVTENTLFNINSGTSTPLLKKGYSLVTTYNKYASESKYLIARKDDVLFSYSPAKDSYQEIMPKDGLPLIRKNETPEIFPSITESDKFYIEINEHDPDEIVEMGPPRPIKTRTYTYDASTNNLTLVGSTYIKNCASYDSKNTRLFTWLCGEGVGTSAPLYISDLNGNQQKLLIGYEQFGLTEKTGIGLIAIHQFNGYFLAQHKGDITKFIVFDARNASPKLTTYTANSEIINELIDQYPQALAINPPTNTIIHSGYDTMTLLRYNDNNEITEQKQINAKGRPVSYEFIIRANKLYIRNYLQRLFVINLDSWDELREMGFQGQIITYTERPNN